MFIIILIKLVSDAKTVTEINTIIAALNNLSISVIISAGCSFSSIIDWNWFNKFSGDLYDSSGLPGAAPAHSPGQPSPLLQQYGPHG